MESCLMTFISSQESTVLLREKKWEIRHCNLNITGQTNEWTECCCCVKKKKICFFFFFTSSFGHWTCKECHSCWDKFECTEKSITILNSVTTVSFQDINSVAISPNDKLLASGSQDRMAKLWSLAGEATIELLGVFRGHRRGIWSVCFSPVDQVLATSSADGTSKLWTLQDFSCLKVGHGILALLMKMRVVQMNMVNLNMLFCVSK